MRLEDRFGSVMRANSQRRIPGPPAPLIFGITERTINSSPSFNSLSRILQFPCTHDRDSSVPSPAPCCCRREVSIHCAVGSRCARRILCLAAGRPPRSAAAASSLAVFLPRLDSVLPVQRENFLRRHWRFVPQRRVGELQNILNRGHRNRHVSRHPRK